MQSELKACPFCGGKAAFKSLDFDGDSSDNGFVMCEKCGACCSSADTLPEATPIAAWNTRVEGDAWTPISMDWPTDAPLDVPLLLAWKDWDGTLVMKVGLAGSTRGGWRHGQATHWRSLVEFPAELKTSTGEGK